MIPVEDIIAGFSLGEQKVLRKVNRWKHDKRFSGIVTPTEYLFCSNFLKGYVSGHQGVYSDIESEEFKRGKVWAQMEQYVGM